MSRSKKKTRTAYYKQVVIGDNIKLGEVLKRVLLDKDCKLPLPQDRHYKPNMNSNDFYVLNEVSMEDNMLFGELMYIEQDNYQTVLNIRTGATRYPTQLVTVEDIKDKEVSLNDSSDDLETNEQKNESDQKQFIDNTLYFGVFENHLIVLQTNSLKISRLGEYFNYILGSSGADVLNDKIIIFKDKPSKEAKKILKGKPAKAVKISQQVIAEVENESQSQTKGFQSASFTLDGNDSKIIEALFSDIKIKEMFSKKLKDNLKDDDLFVEVTLRAKGNRRGKPLSESGQQLINTVATAFANLDDEDFEIQYEGGRIKGGDFRLHKKIRVETFEHGVNTIQLKKEFLQFMKEAGTDS